MGTPSLEKSAGLSEKTKNIPTQALCRLVSPQTGHHSFFVTTGNKLYHFPQRWKQKDRGATCKPEKLNPEKPDVPLNKNDAFQKVQKRRVQEKR